MVHMASGRLGVTVVSDVVGISGSWCAGRATGKSSDDPGQRECIMGHFHTVPHVVGSFCFVRLVDWLIIKADHWCGR